jgi:hypothetical protein
MNEQRELYRQYVQKTMAAEAFEFEKSALQQSMLTKQVSLFWF